MNGSVGKKGPDFVSGAADALSKTVMLGDCVKLGLCTVVGRTIVAKTADGRRVAHWSYPRPSVAQQALRIEQLRAARVSA